MPSPEPGEAIVWPRLWTWSSLPGAAAWLLLAFADPFEGLRSFGSIGYVLALGSLVVVPLALSLIPTPARSGRTPLFYGLAAVVHPFASVLSVVALRLPPGPPAALLAIPYLVETTALALFGLSRLAARGLSALDEVCIDVGLFYLPVGGAWWLSTCAGWTFGYAPVIVELTAVHFHFAGFAVGVMAGLTGRAVPRNAAGARRIYRGGAVVAVSAPFLVAIGIALSPVVEVISASALVAAMTALGLVLMAVVGPRRPHRLSGWLLTVAGLSLIAPMTLALLYALGEAQGGSDVGLQTMAYGHGWLNAFGFALCGLIGWRLAPPASRCSSPGVPLSRLAAGLHVGADYFDRHGLVDPTQDVTGFVADLDAYRRPAFDPSTVHPSVRRFYEHTEEFSIDVRAKWSLGFRLAARLFRLLARGVGQLNLPQSSSGDREIKSRLFAIDPATDGREAVRVWVRTYRVSGRPVYVAAYSVYRFEGVPYMNIAFPLPGGNLTSVLRMDPLPGAPGALRLSTLPMGEQNGDEGVYFANRFLPLRLPLNETITVWPSAVAPRDFPDGLASDRPDAVFARHDMWLFGIPYLRIDYLLTPKSGGGIR